MDRTRALLALLLASSALGCEPGWKLRGMVREPPSEPPSGVVTTGGKPLAGAKVAVTCPDGAPGKTTESGPDGRVSIDHLPGFLSMTCTVEVSHPGYETRTYAVGDLCSWYGYGLEDCAGLTLYAELRRIP